jgi:hypothetical protein
MFQMQLVIVCPTASETAMRLMEEGEWKDTEIGTPQGSVIPYGRRRVRNYVDDNVLGFQHLTEADRFLAEFRGRLRRFGPELHSDKTRRIEFGRFAEVNRTKRGM